MNFFAQNQATTAAAAPGILDVFGGWAASAGSVALALPVAQTVAVEVAFRTDGWLRVRREPSGETFALNLDPFRRLSGSATAYSTAQRSILLQKQGAWAVDVAGPLLAFCFENRLFFRGMDVSVRTDLPLGPASSPAVQVATLRAVTSLYGLRINHHLLAQICHVAERRIGGRPSLLTGQLAAHFGPPGRVLPLNCQPDHVFEPMPEVPELRLAGIFLEKSKPERAKFLRCAAFMGYSILAATQDVNPKTLRGLRFGQGRSQLPWHGYLANLQPQFFEEVLLDLLPEKLAGEAFLEHFGHTIDDATVVELFNIYPVRAATAYCIRENQLARAFFQLWGAAVPKVLATDESFRHQFLEKLGGLMQQSHRNERACGAVASSEKLVTLLENAGSAAGIFGVRASGDGAGGSLVLLGWGEESLARAAAICRQFSEETGVGARLIF